MAPGEVLPLLQPETFLPQTWGLGASSVSGILHGSPRETSCFRPCPKVRSGQSHLTVVTCSQAVEGIALMPMCILCCNVVWVVCQVLVKPWTWVDSVHTMYVKADVIPISHMTSLRCKHSVFAQVTQWVVKPRFKPRLPGFSLDSRPRVSGNFEGLLPSLLKKSLQKLSLREGSQGIWSQITWVQALSLWELCDLYKLLNLSASVSFSVRWRL